jgi:hypothetical protein
VLAAQLLYQRPWRRRLPYLVPVAFAGLSYFVLTQLDVNYEQKARAPRLDSVKGQFYALYAKRTEAREHLPETR